MKLARNGHGRSGWHCYPCDYQRRKEIHPTLTKDWDEAKKQRNPHHKRDTRRRAVARNPHYYKDLYARCGTYHKEYYKRRRQEDPDYRMSKTIASWEKAGVTKEQYLAMFDLQNSLCAICRHPETVKAHKDGEVRRLALDHNHKTGQIRSLLCQRCNRGIGLAKEDPARLRAMADYLEYWKKQAES